VTLSMKRRSIFSKTVFSSFLALAVIVIYSVSPLPAENSDSLSSEQLLSRARSFVGMGDFDAAADDYSTLIARFPEDTVAAAELAKILFWQGNRVKALRLFSSLSFESTGPEERVSFIELSIAQGDFKTAVDLAGRHLKLQPGDNAIRLKLAEMLSWQNHFEASLNNFKTLLMRLPSDSHLRLRYAQVLLWAGLTKEAEVEFAKALDQGGKASIVEEKDRVSIPEAKLELGKLMLGSGASLEKSAELLQAASKYPEHAGEALFNLAMLQLQQGNQSQALTFFKDSFNEDPTNLERRLWLARSLVWNRFYDDGIKHLETLKDQKFRPGETALVLGQALFWSGQPFPALEHLNYAQTQGISSAELFQTRGEAYMALASFTEALDEFRTAETRLIEEDEDLLYSSDPNSSLNSVLKNMAFCYSYLGMNETAEKMLMSFHQRFPGQVDVIIELARVLRRNQKPAQAKDLLSVSSAEMPMVGELLMELGDLNVESGHWHKTRSFYLQAMKLVVVTAEIELRWANRLAQIRDFPKSAGIIKRYIPLSDTSDLKIDLAWVLASMERYEESTGILLRVVADEPENTKAILTLARVKALEKKLPEAFELARRAIEIQPENSEAANFAAQYGADQQDVLIDYRSSRRSVIEALEEELNEDPDNFPIAFLLAQELANQRDFDYALCLLKHLLDLYPNHYAAGLMKARIHGWSRNFCCALCQYEKLCRTDTDNPIYFREAGRTAFWANMLDHAGNWYQHMLLKPVSESLHERIAGLAQRSSRLKTVAEKLVKSSSRAPFERFEEFNRWFEVARTDLSPEVVDKIDTEMLELHETYLLQRHFHLEYRGKLLNKRSKPRRALKEFDRLLETEPGNLEALFDQSQIFCSLGLLDQERIVYNRVLEFAPDHSLIRAALKKLDDDERPVLRFRYHTQDEKGRGSLARMRMHGSRIEAAAYINPGWRATLSGGYRYFRPGIWDGRFRSFETQLSLDGVLSAYTRLKAGIGRNRFSGNRRAAKLTPESTTSGFLDIVHSVSDSFDLSLRFSRDEVYSNDVALRDGTMLETLNFGLRVPVTRRLIVGAGVESGRYSDANRLDVFRWRAEYDLTEFPEIFRLILSGERRDTEKVSRYAFLNGELIDIRYPYWTPQNYTGRNISLQYFRDLSRIRICRADKHYLSLIVSLGNDSIPNPGRRVDWQWHIDWSNRWEAELNGYWHDSDDWKANRFDFYIGYRF
jgi:tetratricopeptide (TPR) repeat protein